MKNPERKGLSSSRFFSNFIFIKARVLSIFLKFLQLLITDFAHIITFEMIKKNFGLAQEFFTLFPILWHIKQETESRDNEHNIFSWLGIRLHFNNIFLFQIIK
jgi:hypothetical protein